MSKYTGPKYKKSRRVGFSILESGKELLKKPYPPGEHGKARRRKISDYGTQLIEKQKVRFMYGLTERQLHKTFIEAKKMRGIVGEDFLKLLESRLDNVVFRMGLANTRSGARQLVNHGHILVNGKKVDIPSYKLKPSDIVGLKEKAHDHPAVLGALEKISSRVSYVSFDLEKMEGVFIRYPERNELSADINESLIVEFYSR
ncbi:MAG: 30S ribosomal protein S4 [Bacilli bacterium]|jgi:small subunit ribosomal protein S4|nr:30S ribosomal protein S4 [Bacilli bacterium]